MCNSVKLIDPICKEALNNIEEFLSNLESSNDERDNKKAKTLSYWIKDYVEFINYEKEFKPSTLKRYNNNHSTNITKK